MTLSVYLRSCRCADPPSIRPSVAAAIFKRPTALIRTQDLNNLPFAFSALPKKTLAAARCDALSVTVAPTIDDRCHPAASRESFCCAGARRRAWESRSVPRDIGGALGGAAEKRPGGAERSAFSRLHRRGASEAHLRLQDELAR